MDKTYFRTPDELADWLESLYGLADEGGHLTNIPWEPAQRAARVIRAPEQPEAPAEYTDWERRVYLRGWRDGAGVPHPEPSDG